MERGPQSVLYAMYESLYAFVYFPWLYEYIQQNENIEQHCREGGARAVCSMQHRLAVSIKGQLAQILLFYEPTAAVISEENRGPIGSGLRRNELGHAPFAIIKL